MIEPSSVQENGSGKERGPENRLVVEPTSTPLSSNFTSQLVADDDISQNLSILSSTTDKSVSFCSSKKDQNPNQGHLQKIRK